MRRRLAIVTLLLFATLVSPATPAGASTAPRDLSVDAGARFNNPFGDRADQDRIKNHIIDTIDRTVRPHTIRAALYALTDQDYADALIAAYHRGVKVRVVLDAKYSERAAAQSLITAVGRDTTARSWVQVCMTGGACIAHGGVNPINHNKFVLFSQAGESRHIVIQTSANQTALNTEKYFNNSYTVVDNSALYGAYLHYFDDLAAMVPNNNYFTTGTAGNIGYYFFPQETGDIVVDILNEVACTGNRHVGTPGTHRSIVRVSAFALHRADVANALIDLADNGCQVDLLYTDSNQVANLTGHANLDLRRLKTEENYLVHSKYFLIEGNYAGHRDNKLTFTGSHNLDFSSLRENDEAMLRIPGSSAHDAYRANFQSMFELATPVASG